MTAYPESIVPTGHTAPVPRRIRARLEGRWVVDTTDAMYLWEWPNYPQYLIPEKDADLARLGEVRQPPEHEGFVRIDWAAADSWFEEDEEVFVHPRDPYKRVDALRSSRCARVELDGVCLAETSAPVMVFETGLPARTYFDRTDVNFEHLRPIDTVTACPYKGRTSGYWTAETPSGTHENLAWSYDFPTRQLLPIAGLVAFFDERVDMYLEGERQERPRTHFSPD